MRCECEIEADKWIVNCSMICEFLGKWEWYRLVQFILKITPKYTHILHNFNKSNLSKAHFFNSITTGWLKFNVLAQCFRYCFDAMSQFLAKPQTVQCFDRTGNYTTSKVTFFCCCGSAIFDEIFAPKSKLKMSFEGFSEHEIQKIHSVKPRKSEGEKDCVAYQEFQ